jgi:guanylate kinase
MSSSAGREHAELRRLRRGSLLVLSAPSGTGKSTVIRRLVDEVEGLGFSVSATTRPPRPGERDGVDYHFIDEPTFARKVAEGEFLEHAEVHGHRYGTLRSATEAQLSAGRDLLLDIDVQGARQVAKSGFGAHLVFLVPPSRAELERRLRGRGSETEQTLRERLRAAAKEMEAYEEFGYCVLNDDVDDAVEAIRAILHSRRSTRAAMTPVVQGVLETFRSPARETS